MTIHHRGRWISFVTHEPGDLPEADAFFSARTEGCKLDGADLEREPLRQPGAKGFLHAARTHAGRRPAR